MPTFIRSSVWSLNKVHEIRATYTKTINGDEEFTPDPTKQHYAQQKPKLAGMALLQKLMDTLNLLDQIKDPHGRHKYKRNDSQMRCHKEFLVAMLKHIFKDDLYRYNQRLVEMFDLQEKGIRNDCIVVTPRRWGKTWSVAMFCAALLYAMPGFSIVVFSTAQRISKLFLSLTVRILTDLLNHVNAPKKSFIVNNVEKLEIENPDGYHNVLQSLPSSVTVSITNFFLIYIHPYISMLPLKKIG